MRNSREKEQQVQSMDRENKKLVLCDIEDVGRFEITPFLLSAYKWESLECSTVRRSRANDQNDSKARQNEQFNRYLSFWIGDCVLWMCSRCIAQQQQLYREMVDVLSIKHSSMNLWHVCLRICFGGYTQKQLAINSARTPTATCLLTSQSVALRAFTRFLSALDRMVNGEWFSVVRVHKPRFATRCLIECGCGSTFLNH